MYKKIIKFSIRSYTILGMFVYVVYGR